MTIFLKRREGGPKGRPSEASLNFFLSCWLFSSQLLDIFINEKWGEFSAAERASAPGEMGRIFRDSQGRGWNWRWHCQRYRKRVKSSASADKARDAICGSFCNPTLLENERKNSEDRAKRDPSYVYLEEIRIFLIIVANFWATFI